ncbi:hypothetical protein ABFX02_02G132900 [Erythranthe guttata]
MPTAASPRRRSSRLLTSPAKTNRQDSSAHLAAEGRWRVPTLVGGLLVWLRRNFWLAQLHSRRRCGGGRQRELGCRRMRAKNILLYSFYFAVFIFYFLFLTGYIYNNNYL